MASPPTREPDAAPGRATTGLLTLDEYERAALRLLPRNARDYYRSGADAERTLRDNRRAFRRWALWPRVLVDVSERRLGTTVLGTEVPFPVLVAPTAYHKLACAEGEPATARAAAALGTVYVQSTLSTCTIEEVAAAAPAGPRWFQLYVHKDRGLTRELVERAVAAGHRALVLTVDTPMLGRRLRDVRHGFSLPDGMTMANLVPDPARWAEVAGDRGSALANYFAARHDASLTWRDVEWLRGLSRLPLVLKGIVRADDARQAVEVGAAGILVSNHGARQLDGAPATIDALPGVVEAVAGRAEVYLDGGVRWGTDVLTALGLGARAVLLGRPILWGLTVGGEAGARQVLEILREELSRAMALAGCPDVRALPKDLVRPARGAQFSSIT